MNPDELQLRIKFHAEQMQRLLEEHAIVREFQTHARCLSQFQQTLQFQHVTVPPTE
ncbi:hypothetical protein SH668x_002921 [Planctomicrobium sp. SH668]|uniref:hypothetical protein n=1 Tax=Planctomicrobium sp. SH668 TaxID=3448126 RepID=UPI003F5B729C